MGFYKSLIINLIGDPKHVYKSAYEIHNIVIHQRFGSKIIENENLLHQLDRRVKRDVYINMCNQLTFQELKQMNYLINSYRNKNIFYYNLFIFDENTFNNNSTSNYYIHNSLSKKETQIKKIIYS